MHDFNLKMIKVMLVILVAAGAFGMISGIGLLKDSYYWRTPFFAMQIDFLKEYLAFARYEHGGWSPWLGSLGRSEVIPVDGGGSAGSVPILLYHGVIEDAGWQPDDVNVYLDDFRAQMFALKRAGYRTITLEEYLAFMNGKRELPERSFLLTFDDARKDSYYPVDPILRVLGYSAVMNVITGRSLAPDSVKSSFHLSQIELRKMIKNGRWEMASHTDDSHGYQMITDGNEKGHALSNRRWIGAEHRLETEAEYADRVAHDLEESRSDIEKHLGIRPIAFAYPFGDFGQESANYPESTRVVSGILRKLFPITLYQTRGSEFMNNYAGDPFMSRRIDMKSVANVSADASADELLDLLEDNRDKAVGYTDDLTKNNGWLRGWGVLTIGDGTMSISDSADDDSGMSFLSGSYLWKEYFLKVKVSMQNGGAFSLLARYRDENNHVACDFSDNHVALTSRVGSQDQLISEVPLVTRLETGRVADAGVAVFGRWAGCSLDGRIVASGIVGESLANGGIGFKMWDTGKKGSSLVVSALKVSADDPRMIGK
jgi:peptidoglycan/xylan/chitin deacetylase (PgdA/CDA1 family)